MSIRTHELLLWLANQLVSPHAGSANDTSGSAAYPAEICLANVRHGGVISASTTADRLEVLRAADQLGVAEDAARRGDGRAVAATLAPVLLGGGERQALIER